MVDTRFHRFAGAAPLNTLLVAIGRPPVEGARAAAAIIAGADELELANPSQVALAAHRDYLHELRATSAGIVIVHPSLVDAVPPSSIAIVADDPHNFFADLLEQLYPGDTLGVVAALMSDLEAPPVLEADVLIGAHVALGPGVEIGRGTVIGPNSVVGAGVSIGRNCVIGPNVSIECAYIGNDVVLHAGARVGCEGFGWLDHGRSNRKIPQLGRVILQDRVEIGANSAVDRGALGDTMIGEGTKIDNLVQIGHNCRIGRNCLIAGMAGLAGSTILEDSVMLGARATISGHLTIGRGSILAANTGATKSFPPGSRIAGFPAQDVRMWRREIAMVRLMNKGNRDGR